ncbi:MAG: acyl-CoA thioesterase [Oscillochloridaceae bacterium umkhey_bin13]
MRRIFTQTIVALPNTIDVNGHVNNLVYLQWMQDVATAHSAAQGWDRARYEQTRSSWVIRSHQIEYLRPALLNEQILLATWIVRFEHVQSPRRYLFLRQHDRKILARAETLWVYVDATIGRPAPIPAIFQADFELVSDSEVLHELGVPAN